MRHMGRVEQGPTCAAGVIAGAADGDDDVRQVTRLQRQAQDGRGGHHVPEVVNGDVSGSGGGCRTGGSGAAAMIKADDRQNAAHLRMAQRQSYRGLRRFPRRTGTWNLPQPLESFAGARHKIPCLPTGADSGRPASLASTSIPDGQIRPLLKMVRSAPLDPLASDVESFVAAGEAAYNLRDDAAFRKTENDAVSLEHSSHARPQHWAHTRHAHIVRA